MHRRLPRGLTGGGDGRLPGGTHGRLSGRLLGGRSRKHRIKCCKGVLLVGCC